MHKIFLSVAVALCLSACGGQTQTSQDQQIAENQKQIEILKQQAEIQRLQNELNNSGNIAASAAAEVYQLAASEVAATLPADVQAQGKSSGQAVTGTDGQQYMYDPDTGSWLLYGAIGAAMGYMAANALNNRNAAKYQPVQKPTAAVQRVYQDYRAKNPAAIAAPKAAPKANNTGTAAQKPAPTYRQTIKSYPFCHNLINIFS